MASFVPYFFRLPIMSLHLLLVPHIGHCTRIVIVYYSTAEYSAGMTSLPVLCTDGGGVNKLLMKIDQNGFQSVFSQHNAQPPTLPVECNKHRLCREWVESERE